MCQTELLDNIDGYIVSALEVVPVAVDNDLAVLDVLEQSIVLINAPVLEGPGCGGQANSVVLCAQSGAYAADLGELTCIELCKCPLNDLLAINFSAISAPN